MEKLEKMIEVCKYSFIRLNEAFISKEGLEEIKNKKVDNTFITASESKLNTVIVLEELLESE